MHSEPDRLDDAGRPRLPKPEHAVTTEAGRRGQAFLLEVHAHLRRELERVFAAVAAMRDGAGAGPVRDAVDDLGRRAHNRAIGLPCVAFCTLIGTHHRGEDRLVFPALRRIDPALGPVLDRLGAEHEVISGSVGQVSAALTGLTEGDGTVAALEAAVARLAADLLSHLEYEESELLGPIGLTSILG